MVLHDGVGGGGGRVLGMKVSVEPEKGREFVAMDFAAEHGIRTGLERRAASGNGENLESGGRGAPP